MKEACRPRSVGQSDLLRRFFYRGTPGARPFIIGIHRAAVQLLCFVLFCSIAIAQPELQGVDESGPGKFEVYPPGATITLLDASPKGSYLGKSGEAIIVPHGATGNTTQFSYRIEHPDGEHKPASVTIPAGYFSSNLVWPAKGQFILEAQGAEVPLKDILRYPGWRTGMFFFGLLFGLGAIVGLRRFYQVRKRERIRQEQYEELNQRRALPQSDENLGRRVLRWTLMKRLGAGTFGTVYLGLPMENLDPGQPVAVKLVKPQSEAEVVRLRNEIRSLKSLDHRHIVKLVDFDWPAGYDLLVEKPKPQPLANEDQPTREVALPIYSPRGASPELLQKTVEVALSERATQTAPETVTLDGLSPISLVFEYVPGLSLAERLVQGPLPHGEAFQLFGQALDAMVQAHRLKIMHRDLKPANIMLDGKGNLKIIDFGLAKSPHTEKATQTGQTPGTVAYMAPEQLTGEPVDPAWDQWALGVIGYEMWASSYPFESSPTNPHVILTAILMTGPAPLPEHVPDRVCLVLDRMLQRDPADRYKTLADVQKDWLALKGCWL